MARGSPAQFTAAKPGGGRGLAWLRLAGAIIAVLTTSFWLFVLESQAPLLGLLVTVPYIAVAGPAWTHPKETGALLVALTSAYGLLLLHAVRHPLLAELALVLPLLCAGLCFLGDALLHPQAGSSRA